MLTSKVSIIIPAYNAELFIRETLRSVLLQSYKNFEVIVVNDGSTDKTKDIINEFVSADKRFYLIEKENGGAASARNLGVEKAKGDLIAFLDSDDLWHPDKLLKQVQYLEKYPQAGFVSCLAVIINENSRSRGLLAGRVLNGNCYKQMLEAGGISGGSIVLVRKECLDKVDKFQTELEHYEDWGVWLSLAKKFHMVTVPKMLVGYRRSFSSKSRNYNNLILSGELLLKRAFEADQNLSRKYYKLCFARDVIGIGAWCFIDGEYKEAKNFVKKGMRINFTAGFTDFQRMGFLVLLTLTSIIPRKAFDKLFLQTILPFIFRLKYEELFTEVCNRNK